MDIKVIGAAGGEVTGSAYLVRTQHATVLVDAGMFQGGRQSEAKNRLPIAARPEQIDAVLLTHAHLDHTGRVPLLIKHGYRKPIFATGATIDLAEIILKDCAKLQSQDAKRKHQQQDRHGGTPFEPLFESQHVTPFRSLTRRVHFNRPVEVADGITARWVEAGHMLGSGCIELVVVENGRKKVVVFSGDLGPTSLPVVREFETFERADVVFLESTYGDRDHRPYEQTVAEFEQIVKIVADSNGKILVPAFAIGRSQQILYHLAIMFLRRDVQPFPVVLDSPMAIEASKVYVKYPDLYDDELIAWMRRGLLPLDPEFFQTSSTADESKTLNDLQGPCAIVAGAGMCNAGRILHHLRHNLPKPTTHVLIVGFQGEGSLGRKLVEGQQIVSIFGRRVPVRARIHTLNGFSGHAGQTELLKWFSTLAPARPQVVLTHGEDRARRTLAARLNKQFQLTAIVPRLGEVIAI